MVGKGSIYKYSYLKEKGIIESHEKLLNLYNDLIEEEYKIDVNNDKAIRRLIKIYIENEGSIRFN